MRKSGEGAVERGNGGSGIWVRLLKYNNNNSFIIKFKEISF